MFFANRVLNPALVLIEVFINLYVLVINRSGDAGGVASGRGRSSRACSPAWRSAAISSPRCIPTGSSSATYCLLLPLILLQAAGVRRPIRAERLVGVPFGAGLGFLYSVTTISGPPLALLFNNQGLVKQEFRAGLALIRVAESCLTAFAYYQLGPVHRRGDPCRLVDRAERAHRHTARRATPCGAWTPKLSAASA